MARKSIIVDYFILEYDRFGLAGLGQDILQELVSLGADVTVYAPVAAKGPQSHLAASNHDKIIGYHWVDDCYTITGGQNIGARYFKIWSPEYHVYIGADILVEATSVAAAARVAFDVERAKGRNFRVRKDLLGNWNTHTRLVQLLEPLNEKMEELLNCFDRPDGELHPFVRARFFDSEAYVSAELINTTSVLRGKNKKNNIVWALIREIDLAREEVLNRERRELLRDVPGLRIYVAKGPKKPRSRVAVFDGRKAWVGSFNLDFLSERVNSEIGVLVDDPAFANTVRNLIAGHIVENSVEYRDRQGAWPGRFPEARKRSRSSITCISSRSFCASSSERVGIDWGKEWARLESDRAIVLRLC